MIKLKKEECKYISTLIIILVFTSYDNKPFPNGMDVLGYV